MELTLVLILIFIAIAIMPSIARRIHFPVIVLELIFGIIIGKTFFDIVPESQVILFLSDFGLIYLIFLVGLDASALKLAKNYFSQTAYIAFFSILIPFLAGVVLSPFAGMHPLLLGTIFSTSSLGLTFSVMKEVKYHKGYMNVLLGSVVLVDILTIFLLAFSLSFLDGSLGLSFFYSLIAILFLFYVPWLLKKRNVKERIVRWLEHKTHFETEVRIAFALIFILTAVSGKLGFHSLIGAFIAGLIIAELAPKASLIDKKLSSFGYGFFIPLFYIFAGSKVDLHSLFSNLNNVTLFVVIILVAIGAKVIAVALVGKKKGLNLRESLAMGFFHATRLSLIIATANILLGLTFIDSNLYSIFVMLALVSATTCPIAAKYILLGRKNKHMHTFSGEEFT